MTPPGARAVATTADLPQGASRRLRSRNGDIDLDRPNARRKRVPLREPLVRPKRRAEPCQDQPPYTSHPANAKRGIAKGEEFTFDYHTG
eukprot:CAMPEP_0173419544 /NCGR_PEP_ID=MMETSP1357-20121228/1336_1 /TAXON_ID=77926 /ORGANISM="Hemiselmis rufescens, Strain PCC563" /LENGTH=88 /DNA_ID=CAMNT_0014382193 /DNA_START=50 /DNA_END=314 /DNA_ORIENTATION=-